jgi:3D (Asp-Asp-Asp) domain-containing protein
MRDRWEEIKEERIRDRRKERRRLQQEIALYVGILKLIAIAMLILIGMATLNRFDAVMAGQDNLSIKIDRLSEEISQANTLYQSADKVAVIDDLRANTRYGVFEITHYCKCTRCCGKNDGITATGTQATAGRTIAVDPEVIPLGTEVIIDGQSYIAEDTGGAIKGNKIDIFCDSHEEAINRGRITREVFVKEE